MRRALVLLLVCSSAGARPLAKPEPIAKPRVAGKGTVTTEHFHSNALGVDKDVVIYLPAGYNPAGKKHYPVFYYLHGMGGDENSWVKSGKLDEAADALGLAAIVVMPDGDNNYYVDSAMQEDYDACIKDGTGMLEPERSHPKTCVKTSKYETYMTRDLIAWVDRHYKTIATREGRGIAGFSMGGYGALMLAMRHPERFSAAASHSGIDALLYKGPIPYQKGKVELYTDVSDLSQWNMKLAKYGDWLRGLYGTDLANWRAHDPAILVDRLTAGKIALYLDCGREDRFALDNGMRYLHDRLLEKGVDHAYYVGPGGHDFGFWKDRLPSSLKFLSDHVVAAQ